MPRSTRLPDCKLPAFRMQAMHRNLEQTFLWVLAFAALKAHLIVRHHVYEFWGSVEKRSKK